jgi:DNA polymerase-3 subunit delta
VKSGSGTPAARAQSSQEVYLVCFFGEDDYSVKKQARQQFDLWSKETGSMDHEIVDANATNVNEALGAIARLREALQTFPLFGSGKTIWFRDCTFLGDDRVAGSSAVTDALAGLVPDLKACVSAKTRLIWSAGKVDRRRSFFKALDKLGRMVPLSGISADDRDWVEHASSLVERHLEALGKAIDGEALQEFVACVGPHLRQLYNEADKLALYAGASPALAIDDVRAVVTRNKQSRAFALGDALGDRDVPRLLRCLDQELWDLKTTPQKSEIGLLYGLISKVRALLLVRELLDAGLLRPERDFNRFKSQVERLPADRFPADKRFNPVAMNAYVLFKALPQARLYTKAELMRALASLLEANRRLVTTTADETLVLQRALLGIALPL